MPDETPPPPVPEHRWADHARRLSRTQWLLLVVFGLVGVFGVAAYVYGYATRPHQTATLLDRPDGASGFVSASGNRTVDVPGQATDTWSGLIGAKGAALGFGFVGGFVIGFIFRAFIKLMTLVTVVVVGGLAALSYFHVLNVDFTAVQKTYEDNAAWIGDQAARLKDVLIDHLPSSGGGAAGLFFGLRRK